MTPMHSHNVSLCYRLRMRKATSFQRLFTKREVALATFKFFLYFYNTFSALPAFYTRLWFVLPLVMSYAMCLVGDSYISRLQQYCYANNIPSLALDAQYDVYFYGQGGGTVSGPNKNKRVIHSINHMLTLPNVTHVYLNIGSNDLCNPHCVSETLCQHILSLAGFILASSPNITVTIGQIHQRSVQPFATYNARVYAFNCLMRDRCLASNDRRLDFAFVRGLCQPSPLDYCDGVHFSDRANLKFYRGVRGAIVRASRS